MRVVELEGALLDFWVAQASRAWEWAHELFPTMTLDPTFVSAGLFPEDGRDHCFLVPNNPMRQGYQLFTPSTSWEHGGPIIERQLLVVWPYRILDQEDRAADVQQDFAAKRIGMPEPEATGSSYLIAAMRCVVASVYGEDVPDEVPA